MKLLFVSGESAGGAPRSTLELAQALRDRGHDVDVLLGRRPSSASLYQRAVNLSIKLADTPIVGGLIGGGVRLPGRRLVRSTPDDPNGPFLARLPENAYRRLHRQQRYDVLIANSLPRVAMKWLNDDSMLTGTPFVVYLREAHAVTHFTMSGLRPSAAVANSRALQRAVESAGHPCDFVPSVVDLRGAETTSTRRTIVLVNPIAENRPDLVATMAAARPDIPFVLQESWPLPTAVRSQLDALVGSLPNVEIRPVTANPLEVYRDARLLLAPYPVGRPRVVLEAQHNGIPVIALDQPALAEVVGPGGVLVEDGADDVAWLEAVGGLWDDARRYDSMVATCRRWAERDEVRTENIVGKFEGIMESIVRREAP